MTLQEWIESDGVHLLVANGLKHAQIELTGKESASMLGDIVRSMIYEVSKE